jgi:hypothetical protein
MAVLEDLCAIEVVPDRDASGNPIPTKAFFQNLPKKYIELPGCAYGVSQFMLEHYANDITKSSAFAVPTDIQGIKGMMPSMLKGGNFESVQALISSGGIPPEVLSSIMGMLKM